MRLNKLEVEAREARKRDEEYKDEQLGLNRRLVWLTGILAVVGLIGGGISAYQTHISGINASAAQANADAAKAVSKTALDQLEELKRSGLAAQESFHIDHRPYVFVGLPQELVAQNHAPVAFQQPAPGNTLKADVYFTNYGRSPAVRLRLGCRVAYGKDALDLVGTVPFSAPIGAVVLSPGAYALHTCESVDKPDGNAIADSYGKDSFVVVFGNIEYFDMWDKSPKYTTDFCSIHLANNFYVGECKGHHEIK